MSLVAHGPWRAAALIVLIVLSVAAAVRIAVGFAYPDMTYDSRIYIAVADNIRTSGCVSAAKASCDPSWGGNQLPGYPAFLAAVRGTAAALGIEGGFIGRGVWSAVIVAQSLFFAVAAAWLALAVYGLTRSAAGGLAAGLIVAVSPVSVAWGRFILTETLATAAVLFVAAELLRSMRDRRLHWFSLGVGLAVAGFLRYDSFFLVAPVGIVAYMVRSSPRARRDLLLLALTAAVPFGAWWVRSVALGLPPIPSAMIAPQGSRPPVGAEAWMKTWATDEPDVANFWMPIVTRDYDLIRLFPENHTDEEKRVLGPLLIELVQHRQREIPVHLDEAFGRMAMRRIEDDRWRYWVTLNWRRAANLWTAEKNLHNDGWPTRSAWLAKVGDWGQRYKQGVLVLAAIAAICAFAMRLGPAAWIVAMGVAAAGAKTLILALLCALEPRYLIEVVPLLEIGVVVCVTLAICRRARTNWRASPLNPDIS